MAASGPPEVMFDTAKLGACLREALRARWGSIEDIRFELLKRHRSRSTFEITVRTAAGSEALIGKAYASDRADVYRAMEAIRRRGFGPKNEVSIPQPLGYVPELHLLLQEKVHGPRVKEVFLTGGEHDRIEGAERCAHWLARFQAVGPSTGPVHRVNEVLDSLDRWSRPLAASGGALADKATRLQRRLEAAARELRSTRLCAGHGHYTCGQVLLAEGRTVAVDPTMAVGLVGFETLAEDRTVALDWDGYDVADPCRDVARFVADLKRLAWKNPSAAPALERTADVFLTTFFGRSGPAVGENLPFYTAATHLRLASRDLAKGGRAEGDIGHGAAGYLERAAAMVDEALRILDSDSTIHA